MRRLGGCLCSDLRSFSSGTSCGGIIGRRQGWWDDSSCGTLFAEEFPLVESNELAEGWCARSVGSLVWWDEVERSLKIERTIGEGNGVGPSDVSGRVGVGGGRKLDSFMVVNNPVVAGRIAVPERPPSLVVLGKRSVGSGGGEEVAIVGSG